MSESPESQGHRLIECPSYINRVLVTSVPYPAELVMRMYASRADSEKRIKEYKEDLSLNEWRLQALTPLMRSFGPAVCSIYNRLVGICESGCCWTERI